MSTTAIITPEQRTQNRLKAMLSVYQGTNRILSGDQIRTKSVDEPTWAAPAWSDGVEITFNAAHINGTDIEDISRLHGLNVHELAHVLYSPRKGSTFMAAVIENGWSHTCNLLEDQRIETLLTSTYPSVRPWLQATVSRWILQIPDADITRSHVLLRGRRYLPKSLRTAARAVYVNQASLKEIDEIIDAYRLLTYPTQYVEGLELVERLHGLLSDSDKATAPCPFGHGERPIEVGSHGRPISVSAQRQARDSAQEEDMEASGPGEDDAEGKDESDAGNKEPGPGNRNDDGSADADGDLAGRAGDGEDVSLIDAVVLEADVLLSEVMSDPEVRRELQRAQRKILGRSAGDGLGSARDVSDVEPLPEYVGFSNRFRKVLDRLRQQADPGWSSRQSSGRINPLRWAHDQDIDSAFDRWDEGIHEAVDLEVVILLDQSGSMSGRIERALNAVWATKRALDRIEASTTVIAFSGDSQVLYRSDEKASRLVRHAFDGGGTRPTKALRQAAEIFQYSRRAQKILITFTDGDWFVDTDQYQLDSEDYIKRIRSGGAVTALGYIPSAEWDAIAQGEAVLNAHGCQISSVVGSDDLVAFMQRIVTASIRRRLR